MYRPKQSTNFAIQRRAEVDKGLEFIAIVTWKLDHVWNHFSQVPGHYRDIIQPECSQARPANTTAAVAEVF